MASGMGQQGPFAGKYALQAQYQVHHVKDRPDLWDLVEDPDHPLSTAWPAFIEQNATDQAYYSTLVEYDELARYQFVITETAADGTISIAASARSVPFFWPELAQRRGAYNRAVLETLPDGGYDTILSRGVRQYLSRRGLPGVSRCFTKDQERDTPTCRLTEAPNALSAISITVRPDRRRRGLAEALVETMKDAARQEHLHLLVVPVRPTRKADYPFVSMEAYIKWPALGGCRDPSRPAESEYVHHPASKGQELGQGDRGVFDPWLRKHLRIGGEIVKVAPCSMTVQGSREDWKRLTGSDPASLVCSQGGGSIVEAVFPGGLVPLEYHVDEGRGVYVEPNIWVYHDLGTESVCDVQTGIRL